MARRAAEQGVRVVILSGDRDLLQLVDDSVHVELAGQKLSEAVEYGPQEVVQKFGVTPGQLVDYKALVGDTSDNIPGVKGIGEKTAVGLIQQYGSLEAIYDNLQGHPGALPIQAGGRARVGLPQPPAGDDRARGADRV